MNSAGWSKQSKLILHSPQNENELLHTYKEALARASELYLVSAYLTEWNETFVLNRKCDRFRFIVGKDFGITRKVACEAVLGWLPPRLKGSFLVADELKGFHPKAMFWKESDGRMYAVIGSSNLTNAAFALNYEANVFCELTADKFDDVKEWVSEIEDGCVPVSEDWLASYRETDWSKVTGKRKRTAKRPLAGAAFSFRLPRPEDATTIISERREQLHKFQEKRSGLIRLFRQCANEKIDSVEFYKHLPRFWSYEVGDRLQGKGFEIKGKHSDFAAVSRSILRIMDTPPLERDDVVRDEMDSLAEGKIPTRKAFLSEMLCLLFPDEYPVLNKPVRTYLSDIHFRAPRGASEGVRYVDIARKLRAALRQNARHPAKSVAELDAVIWHTYGD